MSCVGVSRLPAGRRDDDVDEFGAGGARVLGEAGDALGRFGQLRRGDGAERSTSAPSPTTRLPRATRRCGRRPARGDQQADRVRADVDDCDAHRPHSRRGPGCEAGTVR